MRLLTGLLVLTFALLGLHTPSAYPVGPALSLDKLVEESNVILKAKVVSSHPLEDEWFQKYPGYVGYSTELEVISVIKGELAGDRVVFQHYGTESDFKGAMMFMPQWYDLQKGRPYLIFAKKTDEKGVLRQLWKHHKIKEDQGVVMAADERRVAKGTPIKEVIWAELNRLLDSKTSDDVVYAIRQLHEMSGGGWDGVGHFDREEVLGEIGRFIASRDEAIARQTILAVGSASPYLHDWNTAHWLATIGNGSFEGLASRNKEAQNTGAARYWKHLAGVADGDGPADIRSLAIRALGRAQEPALYGHIPKWADDPSPDVRRSAAILVSDYPGGETRRLLKKLAADKEPGVRVGAVRGIGFGQMEDFLPLLDELLKDEEINVRTAAALSIISFGPDKAGGILKSNKNNADFRSVFVNQLAAKDPEPYLDDLVEIVRKRMEPTNFWGGTIPHYQSWLYLFEYVKARPAEAIRSGELDKYLDALEAGQFHSSSMPRDIYAFYLKHGLDERAKAFRKKCKTAVSFDMELYFNRVDASHAAKRADR